MEKFPQRGLKGGKGKWGKNLLSQYPEQIEHKVKDEEFYWNIVKIQ